MPQFMPAGELVTVPVPVIAVMGPLLTVSCGRTGKVTDGVAEAPSRVTVIDAVFGPEVA